MVQGVVGEETGPSHHDNAGVFPRFGNLLGFSRKADETGIRPRYGISGALRDFEPDPLV